MPYEIIVMNIVFWSVWIMISLIPEKVMGYIIENHETFFGKSEKSS